MAGLVPFCRRQNAHRLPDPSTQFWQDRAGLYHEYAATDDAVFPSSRARETKSCEPLYQ